MSEKCALQSVRALHAPDPVELLRGAGHPLVSGATGPE